MLKDHDRRPRFPTRLLQWWKPSKVNTNGNSLGNLRRASIGGLGRDEVCWQLDHWFLRYISHTTNMSVDNDRSRTPRLIETMKEGLKILTAVSSKIKK